MWLTESKQWYRQIGLSKYRFRMNRDSSGVRFEIDRAIAYRKWERVHNLFFRSPEN
jgi:hypothetical protein